MKTEYPSDLTRLACPNEDCDWYGDIFDLELAERKSTKQMVCLCPVCAEIVFEEYDPVVHSVVSTNGDNNSEISDQGHSA